MQCEMFDLLDYIYADLITGDNIWIVLTLVLQ